MYFNAANTLEENPYQVVNFKVGLESEHYDVYFWIKNSFDEEYRVHRYPGWVGYADEYAAPRTFGLSFTARF